MDPHDDRLVRLLADARNRAVLEAVTGTDRAVSVSEIAEHVLAQETTRTDRSRAEALERIRLSLHHDRLPRLDEAGLLAYDHEAGCVRDDGYGGIDAQWSEITAIDDLLAHARAADESTIGVLEGRDAVYDACRRLADEADDELFLIYSDRDLLDEACLPHAADAIDRDVAFYAGANSREGRAFFDRHLPGATIWEPQFDWLNDRSSRPRISRLVVADREAVVVGLWDDTDGTRTEIGMVGEGERNPLVVLVRELLGPRLDHLDYQSEDLLERLPFEP